MEKEIKKQCYEFEEKYNWVDLCKISRKFWPKDLIEKYHLTAISLYTYALEYLISDIKMDNASQYVENKRSNTDNALFMTKNSLCEWLLSTNDFILQEELIVKGKLNVSYVHPYTLSLADRSMVPEVKSTLGEIFDNHNKRNRKRREEFLENERLQREEENYKKRSKKLIDANIIADMLLKSNHYDIMNFSLDSGIAYNEIRDALNLLRRNNKDKYNLVVKKVDDNFLNEYDYLKDVVGNIVDDIENGVILPNGERRNFDIIDYYKKYGYDLYAVKRYNNLVMPTSCYITISHFIGESFFPEIVKEDEINNLVYGIKYIYKGRVITTEEKENIYEFLKNVGAPINAYCFSKAISHYVDGELDLSKER